MAVSVAIESPLQDGRHRTLVEALDALSGAAGAGRISISASNIEEMAADDTTVFVARDQAGKAVGLGALKDVGHDAGARTWARSSACSPMPAVRGQRIGVDTARRDLKPAPAISASNGWCLKPAWARGWPPPSGFMKTMASPNVAPSSIIPIPAIPGSLKRSCPHDRPDPSDHRRSPRRNEQGRAFPASS
jgi:hypothetical protein